MALFICVISSFCFASEPLTDSRGYTRNGRLEEYDRRMRESNKTKFDKRGYYVNPEYRRDLENRSDPEEYEKKDDVRESLYFNTDVSPKKGTFATDEQIERMMKEYDESVARLANSFPSRQEEEYVERLR